MTTIITTEGVEITDDVNNAIVRAELHVTMDALLMEDDPGRRAYLLGVYLGYSVALGMLDVEVLDEARRHPYTGCMDLETALIPPRVAVDVEPRLRACGVRWGFYEATRFDPRADECAFCRERLLPPDEFDWCHKDQVSLCGEWDDCLASWHGGSRCSQCETV